MREHPNRLTKTQLYEEHDMATANITTPKTAPSGMELVLAELDATISILSHQPESDTAATHAMLRASTARAVLRDLMDSLQENLKMERRYTSHYWTVCHELKLWAGYNKIELPDFAKNYGQFDGGMPALMKSRESIDNLLFGHPKEFIAGRRTDFGYVACLHPELDAISQEGWERRCEARAAVRQGIERAAREAEVIHG